MRFCILGRKIVLSIALFFNVFFAQISNAQNNCLDTECHGGIITGANAHVPAEESCNGCHEQFGTTHPAPAGAEFALLEAMPGLCYSCHEDLSGENNVHSPVMRGNCPACHNPHAAPNAYLLRKSAPEICFDCHDSTGNKNGSVRKKILGKKYAHGPAAAGECNSCHLAHGSEFNFLLNAAYPRGNYAQGQTDAYEICFSCHDPALAANASDPAVTEFRNGEQNLHFLHVQNEKGRSCRTCHDIHGSDNPHLIAESVRFNKWDMPFTYAKNENGGSCLCGCHRKMTYQR